MTSAGRASLRGREDETSASVLLLRHAETEWSVAHRHTGRTDIPLTDEGRARAQALAPAFSGLRFALVLSSPLSRARETARLAGLPEPELDDDLLEWDYGDAEGRTAAEVRGERPGWVLWRDGAPGGESPDDVAVRADRVIERLLSTEGDVCVVGHGHMLRVLAGRWLEEGPAFGQRLPLAAGHLGVLGFERGARVLRGWGLPQPPGPR